MSIESRCTSHKVERPPTEAVGSSRRHFLAALPCGLASAALLDLLTRSKARAGSVAGESDDAPPHHPPRAKRVIQIFLCGGMSHVDSFDHKPMLARSHGKSLGGSERPDVFFGQVGLLHQPFFAF